MEMTDRRSEVLREIGTGATVPTIAVRLGISARTVKHHADNLRRMYEVPTMRDLIPIAQREESSNGAK